MLNPYYVVYAYFQVLYLSNMYTRGELALRIGLFYTSASLSGAFGGLLAHGLSSISGTSLAGWRWIFIVEGLIVCQNDPIEVHGN